MSELLVPIVVAILGSNALLAVVNAIINAVKKPSAIELSLVWLLQDKLEFLMTREIQRGSTTVEMKKFIHKGYNFYHSLGGNGDMTAIVHDYDNLEVNYTNHK